MIHYFVYDSQGQIYRSGTNTRECVDLIAEEESGTLVEHDCFINPSRYYYANGTLTEYPENPSNLPVFDYALGAWVADAAVTSAKMRDQRNRLLKACDYTQLADAPVNLQAWQTYRQTLRDLPSQPGFPNTVVWPVVPS